MKFKARRQARELALIALYQYEVNLADSPLECLKINLEFKSYPEEVLDYTKVLLNGILKYWDKLNELITKFSIGWKLERISIIDRNILRIGIFEILYLDYIPDKVAINEAVELAKNFSSEESYLFINGILDNIFKHKKELI